MFGFWRKSKETAEKKIAVENQDVEIEENISLVAERSRGAADRAGSVARERMQEAAREELQELRMIEDGRCPKCGRKVEMFLYTSICRNCGWNTHITPQQNGVIVNLKTGESLKCDKTFMSKQHEMLCVKDQVVVAKVPKDNVDFVSYLWSEEELNEKQAKFEIEHSGVCAWCNKKIAVEPVAGIGGSSVLRKMLTEKTSVSGNGNGNGSKPEAERTEQLVVYMAFGAYQEKFTFCCQKCLERFQHHYPTRVHRNCYERECAECDQCIKRFDVPKGKGNYSRLMEEAAR